MAPGLTSGAPDSTRPAGASPSGGPDAGQGQHRPSFGRLTQYAGFAPAIALFGAFFIVPLGLIVCYSFWTVVDYNVVHDWTLDNYQYFFSVGTYVRTLWATIWVSVAATALTIAIAFPFAYWIARYVPRRLQKVLLVLVILPFWTSYLLRVYSWLNILGEQGAINRFLQWTGLTDHSLSLFLYDRPAVILVLAYLYFPFAALTLYASLERFDWEQFKAAMDLGATPLMAIRKIMLPQIRPGITTSVIFVFIPILGEYLTPQLVGGARGVMIGNLIVNFFSGAQYTRGAAAALLVAALIVALLIVCRRSLEVQETYAP
jgi:spermidine/putrescine transport system permease protein